MVVYIIGLIICPFKLKNILHFTFLRKMFNRFLKAEVYKSNQFAKFYEKDVLNTYSMYNFYCMIHQYMIKYTKCFNEM